MTSESDGPGIDPRTPVLIGWGSASRREPEPGAAVEAADLIVEAARIAVAGRGTRSLLEAVDWVGVTDGLTRYADPGRLVAERIGATPVHTVLAKVGVMQQTLVSYACEAVSSGRARLALVAGAEARYREVRAAATGAVAEVTVQPEGVRPDETLEPDAELVLPAEVAAGLTGAPGFYALLDSEWRASHGRSLGAHRDELGALYARFSEIASRNPHAVRPTPRDAAFLRDASAANPMVAFPYTKLMITTWTVDQGSALVLATAATAEQLGVPRSSWLFPVAAVESNHVVPVAARRRLTQPSAMRIMARELRDRTGLDPARVGLLDLYSPFPVAVLLAAEGLAVPRDRDLTLTGGMSFAGGPFNSFELQALVRAAEQLAAGPDGHALVTCVSGLYTKQGLLVLGSDPPPRPFRTFDVTAAVAEAEPQVEVADLAAGRGTVVASTVLFADGRPGRAVAVIDLRDGRRTVARSHDPRVTAAIVTEDLVGAETMVVGEVFEPVP